MLKRTLLVTGANGFIAGAVARAWRRSVGDAIGLVRLGGRGDYASLGFPVHAAPLNADTVAQAVAHFAPDVLLHAAGSASIEASFRDPIADFGASVETLHAVLEGVRRSPHRPRVLYPSSAAVYGEPDTLPIPESAPIRSVSPYGHHKAVGELLAREYAICFAVPVLVFRLFSVFGPHQKRLLVRELFEQFYDGQEVTIQGTGEETRDFLHEDDLAATLLAILPHLTEPHVVVNLATGRGTRVRDLAKLIGSLLRSPKEVRCAKQARAGHPANWIADVHMLNALAPSLPIGAAYDLEGRVRATLEEWACEAP
jgi:UDP-glucose 4-epimerase